MKNLSKNKGFTIIELMVVLSIIFCGTFLYVWLADLYYYSDAKNAQNIAIHHVNEENPLLKVKLVNCTTEGRSKGFFHCKVKVSDEAGKSNIIDLYCSPTDLVCREDEKSNE